MADQRDALRRLLVRTRNADGGWGYYASKSSRLEATAWAALALRGAETMPRPEAALARWPASGGLLLERYGGEPNYGFHGLALLAMRACSVEHAGGTAALVAGIQRVKGLALEQSPLIRQDNSLQAWSWIAGTVSWVEPTAWCLLALKKWRSIAGVRIEAARIDDAERLLIDRACSGGGWNYGNGAVMGQDLRPYVPTTAAALLAMQDRLAEPAVARGLDYLDEHATSERSGTALGLALLALEACGRRTDAVRAALVEQLPRTMEIGNQAAIALAAYALGPRSSHDAFLL